MAYTRNEVSNMFSLAALIILVAIAGYALHLSTKFSLPLPLALEIFTLLLPIITALALPLTRLPLPTSPSGRTSRLQLPGTETTSPTLPSSSKPPHALRPSIIHLVLTIYATVIVTLAGTYIAPTDTLTCGLEEKWKSLFQSKNADAIRTIQDALQCCGFRTPVDRAFPFPDKTHSAKACVESLGYTRGCVQGWRGIEQKVGGLLIAVGIAVSVWQAAMMYTTTTTATSSPPKWVTRLVNPRQRQHDRDEDAEHGRGEEGRYRDVEEIEGEEDEVRHGGSRAIEGDERGHGRGVVVGTDGVRSVIAGEREGVERNAWAGEGARGE